MSGCYIKLPSPAYLQPPPVLRWERWSVSLCVVCKQTLNKSNCWPKTNQLQPFYKLAGHLAVNLIFWNLLLKKGYNASQHLSHNPSILYSMSHTYCTAEYSVLCRCPGRWTLIWAMNVSHQIAPPHHLAVDLCLHFISAPHPPTSPPISMI